MKKSFTLILMVLCATALFAQAPEKFSYQAVVRNANNSLVSNALVGMRVSILKGSATGSAVYVETHFASTNANGLVTVEIGGGTVLHGDFNAIEWSDGPYFLMTETDPSGSNNYSVSSTQQLLSVPYALYSKEAGNGFSGDYNDLTNVPQIPQIPANVSYFNNDVGYITMDSIPTFPSNVSAFTNDAGYITSYTEVDPEFNAWDKDYDDLINKPIIPTVPTNVSAFVNDVPYLTSFVEQQIISISNDTIFLTGGSFVKLPEGFDGDYNSLINKPVLFSGDYNDLTNTPTIPTVPTNVSAFTNDVGYITNYTEQQILTISNDTIFLTGGSFVKLPEGFDGDYNSLTNKPVLFSGDYNDLTNTPTIPVVPNNVSAFTNDVPYITAQDIPEIPIVPTNVSAFANDAGYITMDSIPTIPVVPTNVSAFENDVPYLTSYTEQQVLSISNDTIFLTGGSFVKLPEGFNGDYNSLTNKPNLFSGDYNDLSNTPQIPQIPTDISYFNNDAGYITMASVPVIPSEVSAFINDAGYITSYTENQTLADVTAIGNSAGSRQLKEVSDPTESYDAVNLRTLTMMMDALRAEFQQQQEDMQHQIDSLKDVIDSLHPNVFVCGTSQLTDIEGNKYNTVQIGGQCWMAENLRTTKYADESDIPQGYWYYPNGESLNKQSYGLLYNWSAMMHGESSSNSTPSGVQGICPDGWHIPSDVEWVQLKDYLSSQNQYWCGNDGANIAKALSSTTEWESSTNICAVGNDLSTNNVTNFNALPAGFSDGNFYNFGLATHYWSATGDGSGYAFYYNILLNSAYLSRDRYYKHRGYSVRCIYNDNHSSFFPKVTTDTITDITANTATVGGHIILSDNTAVISCGICWSTSHNPTLFTGSHTTDSYDSVNFTSNITGLAPNLTYYVRAYATNIYGTIYGNEMSFSTPINSSGDEFSCLGTPILIDIDSNLYNTVQIGNQCWMRENLKTTHYSDGTAIPFSSATFSSNPCWYYPFGDSSSKQIYGLLYNWPAIMHNGTSSNTNPSDIQGICPTGWHVPSDAEWTQLTDYVSSQSNYVCNNNFSNIAKALASTMGWQHTTNICNVGNNPDENNVTGFGALPAGCSDNNIVATSMPAYFWSSTLNNNGSPYHRTLHANSSVVYREHNRGKNTGLSVRCLRDDNGGGTTQTQPTVITGEATNITSSSATFNGTVSNPDNVTIVAQGFEWRTNQDTTYTVLNTTGESFSYNLSGLSPNSSYIYRAFVNTSEETHYGEEKSFITSCTGPIVIITAYEDPDLYAYILTASGAVNYIWNTGDTSAIIIASSNVDTSYSVIGIDSYGCVDSASLYVLSLRHDGQPCPGTPTVTDIDGNVYNTVQIGNQCWMRENLRVMHYADGTDIPAGGSNTSFTTPYYYDSPSSSIPLLQRGYLYNWSAAMHGAASSDSNPSNVQGVCPIGWHLPSNAEWTTMTNYVSAQSEYNCGGNNVNIAKALAFTEGWNNSSDNCTVGNNQTANNATGFSAIPAGLYVGSIYYYAGYGAHFWSSTEDSSINNYAYYRNLDYHNVGVDLYYYNKDKCIGRSVRCLRDDISSEDTSTTTSCHTVKILPAIVNGQQEPLCPTYGNLKLVVVDSVTSNPIPNLTCSWSGESVNSYSTSDTSWVTIIPDWYNHKYEASVTIIDTLTGCTASTTRSIDVWDTLSPIFNSVLSGGHVCVSSDSSYRVPDFTAYFTNQTVSDNCYPFSSLNVIQNPTAGTIIYEATEVTITLSDPCGNESQYPIEITPTSSSILWIDTVVCEHLLPLIWNDDTLTEAGFYYDTLLNSRGCDSVVILNLTTLPNPIISFSVNGVIANNRMVYFEGEELHIAVVSTEEIDTSSIYWSNAIISNGIEIVLHSDSYHTDLLYSFCVDVFSTNGCLSRSVINVMFVDRFDTLPDNPTVGNQPCLGMPTVTDIDGNVYNTVQIGDQCWMRENLRTTRNVDGSSILLGSDTSTITAYRYCPNNDSSNVHTYGYLYNWKAVMHYSTSSNANPSGVQGICPNGWHVPSNTEWAQLINYIRNQNQYVCGSDSRYIAKSMAATTGWNRSISSYYTCNVGYNQSSNNATGFSALPVGRYYNGYGSFGSQTVFWSSTESSIGNVLNRYISYNSSTMERDGVRKDHGCSVRCLRDSDGGGTTQTQP